MTQSSRMQEPATSASGRLATSRTDTGGWLAAVAGSRWAVAAAVVAPGLWPLWPLFVTHDTSVSADPAKYVLHHLGFTAAAMLVAVLMLSPLRVLLPRWRPAQRLQRHRRFVGVSAFVYAALHVVMHFIYEGGFGTFQSDWKKPFIFVGMTAFAILLVLALTSVRRAVHWMGQARWKWLHRFVYLAALLVVYHQISARKVFPMQVVWLFGPLLVFELLRIVRGLRSGAKVSAK